MHRILITGSNGLLGQKLVHLLRGENHDVLATSLGPNRISEKQGYSYQELDITDAIAVDKVFQEFKPTAVINTAALTLVDLCEEEQERCHQINVLGVENLFHACKKSNSHFLQVSTDFVFNGKNGPYSEEDTPDPLSVYAKSKFDAEQLLIHSDYKNWSIARTIILYGVGENMSRSNIVLWARETLKKGGPMNIVDDQFRAPTLAEDLAIGCWSIIENQATGIYHLSGPETMSVLDCVLRIAKHYDFDVANVKAIKTATLAQAATRPPHTGFVIDKAKRDLDYNPRTIEDGLALLDVQLPL